MNKARGARLRGADRPRAKRRQQHADQRAAGRAGDGPAFGAGQRARVKQKGGS